MSETCTFINTWWAAASNAISISQSDYIHCEWTFSILNIVKNWTRMLTAVWLDISTYIQIIYQEYASIAA